jgi:uncharacterized membrane protein (DUF4010 family)
LSFARASHRPHPPLGPLAYGVVAACTVAFLRVLVATTVLNAPLAWTLAPYLAPPFLVGCALFAYGLQASTTGAAKAVDMPTNPLQLRDALQMAVLFQLVLFGVAFVRQGWGNLGVVMSGVALGLTDIDALTISMARGAATGLPLDVAAHAVAAGVLTNTVVKLGIALVVGTAQFRRVAGPSLAALALVAGALLALV